MRPVRSCSLYKSLSLLPRTLFFTISTFLLALLTSTFLPALRIVFSLVVCLWVGHCTSLSAYLFFNFATPFASLSTSLDRICILSAAAGDTK